VAFTPKALDGTKNKVVPDDLGANIYVPYTFSFKAAFAYIPTDNQSAEVRYILPTKDGANNGWDVKAGVTTAPTLPCTPPNTNADITCTVEAAASVSTTTFVTVKLSILSITDQEISVRTILKNPEVVGATYNYKV
jgi:hypothetical protein